MPKKTLLSPTAPKIVGPYSHAVEAQGFTFVSGMLGVDPATGKLADGVQAQAERSLANLRAVLADCGLGMESVVKTTVFLTDMANFADVNAVYAAVFTSDCPARSCVAVAALPLGALVEIEAVAESRGV